MFQAVVPPIIPMSLLFLFFSTVNNAIAASDPVSVRYFNDFETESNTGPYWLNTATRVADESGYFSRTDANHPFGIGWRSQLPGGDGSHTMQVDVSFKARSSLADVSAQLVFILQKNGEQVYWNAVTLGGKLHGGNDWKLFKGIRQVVPAAYTTGEYVFTCYVWNNDPLAVVDIDDFGVTIEGKSPPSFLPEYPQDVKFDQGEYVTVASAGFLQLEYDKINGGVRITDSRSGTLMKDFWLFTEGVSTGGEWPTWDRFLRYEGNQNDEDERSFVFSYRKAVNTKLTFVMPNHGHRLDIRLSSAFSTHMDLRRQSVFIRYDLPLEQIGIPGQIPSKSILFDEYWLGKSGSFSWSSGIDSWVICRPLGVSSVQLDVPGRACWVNADATFDHPLLHWPLGKESLNKFEDASYTRWKPGDTLIAEFSVYHQPAKSVIPRISVPPKGKLATFILTEHADYTSMRSQRAVEFGSDTSTSDYASSGLFGRRIPTTKSVFFFNPENVSNADRSGFEKSLICSTSESQEFCVFLNQLRNRGTEIAIHTPEHHTSVRSTVRAATLDLKNKFGTRVWIDHGYDNGKKSNREDLVCDGFKEGTSNYVGDILEASGIDYLWNGFFEDSAFYEACRFNSELTVPHPAFEPAYPRPAYWCHAGRTGGLVHFPTTATLDPPDGSMWNYYLGDARLDFLSKSRGTFIGHYYPARIDSSNGFFNWQGAVWTINPEFDKALERISSRRDSGDFWVMDVSNYLDRAIKLDSISSWTDESGVFHVRNDNPLTVNGVTFEIPLEYEPVSEKFIRMKKAGDSRFFWFDMIPKEEVRVIFIEKKKEQE